MTELKPCPFCGGEARYTEKSRFHIGWVYCPGCGAASGYYNTEAEAIAAWNTRAEQTCHTERSDCFECSECAFFDAYAAPSDFNYCPNCGAKVVSE